MIIDKMILLVTNQLPNIFETYFKIFDISLLSMLPMNSYVYTISGYIPWKICLRYTHLKTQCTTLRSIDENYRDCSEVSCIDNA